METQTELLWHQGKTLTWSASILLLVLSLWTLALVGGCNRKGNNTTASRPPALPDVAPIADSRSLDELDSSEIVTFLGHEDSGTRLSASDRIAAESEPPVDELLQGLKHQNYHVRAGAAFTLGRLQTANEEAVLALEELAKNDEREAVRDAAVFALAALAEKQ